MGQNSNDQILNLHDHKEATQLSEFGFFFFISYNQPENMLWTPRIKDHDPINKMELKAVTSQAGSVFSSAF